MSHDVESAWAGTELAKLLSADPSLCFNTPPTASEVSTYAGREGKTRWPHADGVIDLSVASTSESYGIAVEYKRPNEGLHGILTALGQAHAYLRKGYSASVMVLPESYPSLADVAAYATDVLDNASRASGIGLFVYKPPDLARVSPFEGRIVAARRFDLEAPGVVPAPMSAPRVETQWVHVREGSSDPDAFFRYLQAVKLVGGDDRVEPEVCPPQGLIDAVERLSPGADLFKYLSNSTGDNTHDRAWRYFWYANVLTTFMMVGWTKPGTYAVNHVLSRIKKADGTGYKQFFSGRSDSNKNKVVRELNSGSKTEPEAWEFLAQKFRARAHSYREDLDSGLARIGFIDADGRLTGAGYQFVDVCEKSGDPNTGEARDLLASSLLNEGGLASFLHYIHKLSDELFSSETFKFCRRQADGNYIFDNKGYLEHLEDELAGRLHVLRKVSARGGVARKPFQAELAILRSFGLIQKGFRIGVGVPINWPEVQRVLERTGSSLES